MLVMCVMLCSSSCAMRAPILVREKDEEMRREVRHALLQKYWKEDLFTTNKIFILQKSNRPFFKKKISSRDKEQFFHSYC